MTDLTTDYVGLHLANPLVASSSPLCMELDVLREMEDAGIAAVVLPSLFEEQLDIESHTLDDALWAGSDSYAESLSYFPSLQTYNRGLEGYLEHIRRVKQAIRVPVFASLNGRTPGGWTRIAKLMVEAGADAIELNIYLLPTNPEVTSEAMENEYAQLVRMVRHEIAVPLAVKLCPFITAPVSLARRLAGVGADGLVLFNRFYQPDLDIENLGVEPTLALSTPHELLLRLHWTAILYGRVPCDLGVTGGVHSARDVLKVMMAGGKVAMMTSALLQRGVGWLRTILTDLRRWMEDHEYESIRQMQGSLSLRRAADPSAYERANYMRLLRSYSRAGAKR